MKIPRQPRAAISPLPLEESLRVPLIWTDPVTGERLRLAFHGPPDFLTRLLAEGFVPEISATGVEPELPGEAGPLVRTAS